MMGFIQDGVKAVSSTNLLRLGVLTRVVGIVGLFRV